jgi:hypothetical protein
MDHRWPFRIKLAVRIGRHLLELGHGIARGDQRLAEIDQRILDLGRDRRQIACQTVSVLQNACQMLLVLIAQRIAQLFGKAGQTFHQQRRIGQQFAQARPLGGDHRHTVRADLGNGRLALDAASQLDVRDAGKAALNGGRGALKDGDAVIQRDTHAHIGGSRSHRPIWVI